jgi:hypothetical protein
MITINQNDSEKQRNMPDNIVREIQDDLKEDIMTYPESWYMSDKIQANAPGSQFVSENNTAIQGSSATSIFQIPTGGSVWNFSKFILNFQIRTGLAVNNNFLAPYGVANYVLAPWSYYLPFIQELDFYTANGTHLCDLRQLQNYSRMTSVMNLSSDTNTGNTSRGFACRSQRQAQYTLAANTATIAAYVVDPYVLQVGNNEAQQPAETINDPAIMNLPYQFDSPSGVQYLQMPANMGPGFIANDSTVIAEGGIGVFNYSIRLGDLLFDSIFNCSKLVYLSKAAFIKITWQPFLNCFMQVRPDFNAIAYNIITPAQANQCYEIRNLNLQYYRMANPDICNAIISQQSEQNVPMIIPYVDYDLKTFPIPANNTTGVNQISTFRMSSNNIVSTLEKCYFGIFSPDGYLGIYNNSNNINEIVVQQILCSLNGYVIKNNNLAIRDDIPEYSTDKKNGLCSYRGLRYSGVYPVIFDSNKLSEIYNGRNLCGKELLPSNDIQITFNCQVANVLNYAGNYSHVLFNVQNRMFFFKNGEAYTVKV